MSTCDLPDATREIETRAIAPPPLPDAVIDLAGCDVFEATVYLLEHEKAGHRFESWPRAVQHKFEGLMFDWQNRQGAGRDVRAITTAIVPSPTRQDRPGVASRNAVMVVHHAAKQG